MKKKILLYMLLLFTFLSLLIKYKIKNVNAFALYAISLPQEEKFDIFFKSFFKFSYAGLSLFMSYK